MNMARSDPDNIIVKIIVLVLLAVIVLYIFGKAMIGLGAIGLLIACVLFLVGYGMNNDEFTEISFWIVSGSLVFLVIGTAIVSFFEGTPAGQSLMGGVCDVGEYISNMFENRAQATQHIK